MKMPSKTADAAAAVRAAHYVHGSRPLVHEDPLAIQLVSRPWRYFLKSGWLYRWMMSGPFKLRVGAFGQIVGRAAFVEEVLLNSVNSGLDQFVILGAGLDSVAYRRKGPLASKLRVFELDHP